MPHGEVNKQLDDTKRVYPTISCNTINMLCSCIGLVCLVNMMNVA